MALSTAAELFTWMNHVFFIELEEKQTLDKMAWIFFNRKINMNKSSQSPLDKVSMGLETNYQIKFCLPSEHANKSPVTESNQVPFSSSPH